MPTKVNSTLAQTFADAVKTAIDAGSGPGTIKLYNGTQPATPNTAITTQTLLATLTFSDPCGTASSGVLTFSAITDDGNVDATGTPTWARIADSAGNAVVDMACGSGQLEFTPAAVSAGAAVSISSLTLSFA